MHLSSLERASEVDPYNFLIQKISPDSSPRARWLQHIASEVFSTAGVQTVNETDKSHSVKPVWDNSLSLSKSITPTLWKGKEVSCFGMK